MAVCKSVHPYAKHSVLFPYSGLRYRSKTDRGQGGKLSATPFKNI